MGIDAMPLRTQSDRRLVRLVREGYESAFEEIVRRYRRPLDRFAASIVGGHSEDVTQDSFRKALVALRRDGDEIELRPWLYRIVRNTALNDLRDRPPAAAELAEELMAGGRSAAAEAEARAEVAMLTTRLRALPENQRAALVMRELEGMSHEEIAAALGISGGAARQAIARGRAAVRAGFGALVPLPLLRALASGDGAASGAAETLGAGGAGAAAGGAGASLLGGGGAAALKMGLATVVVAGGIGAGVAIDHHGGRHLPDPPPAVATSPAPPTHLRTPTATSDEVEPIPSPVVADSRPWDVSRDQARADDRRGDRHGRDHADDDLEAVAVAEPVDDDTPTPPAHGGGGPGPSDTSGHRGGGPGPSEPRSDHGSSSGTGRDSGSGGQGSGSGHDGRSGGGDGSGGDSGSFGSDGSGSGSGSGSGGTGSTSGSGSGSTSSGSSSGGHGSDDPVGAVAEVPPVEITSSESSSGGPGPSSSTSGGDGSGSSGPSPMMDDSGSGSSGGPEISP